MDRNENIKCPSDGHNYRKNVLLKNSKKFSLWTCTMVLKELQYKNATFHTPHLNGSYVLQKPSAQFIDIQILLSIKWLLLESTSLVQTGLCSAAKLEMHSPVLSRTKIQKKI